MRSEISAAFDSDKFDKFAALCVKKIGRQSLQKNFAVQKMSLATMMQNLRGCVRVLLLEVFSFRENNASSSRRFR